MSARGRLASRGIFYESVCLRCWARSYASQPTTAKKSFAPHAKLERSAAQIPRRRSFRREYFSANGTLGTSTDQPGLPSWRTTGIKQLSKASSPLMTSSIQHTTEDSEARMPQDHHISESLDRRKPQKAEVVPISVDAETMIPLDASSQLSAISTTLPASSLRRRLTTYLALSKPRLSFLMVLTTATAYSLYPVPAVLLSSTTIAPSLSALTLVFLTVGTGLCSASANAFNMLLEPQHDAKMSRTRNRPLVRGLITKKGAFAFAATAGVLGVGGLWFGVNPTVAFLGGFTIFLYAGVYTPMKRISVLNTWVGAIVGSIPPLMGWAAAAGQSAAGSGEWQELLLGEENAGGWLLAGLLFAWQFPHFNALSWTIREEYKNAGYRMLAWTNTKMNGRVALRYSLLFFPICFGLTWCGVTDRGFVVTSSVVNAWMVREAWKFWRKEGQKGSARGLFWASVWHLPVVMVLAMAHKQGLWEGIWRRAFGEQDDERDIWDGEEDELDGEPDRVIPALPLVAART
ncbi:Protoheme IX farnesyltransferase, mitochondrial [Xylographa trunciseda]|nr:Protoheme IX farnesyltransferase, mitochondrial [Xylographa trunciseda]